jgi:hypothetical protein
MVHYRLRKLPLLEILQFSSRIKYRHKIHSAKNASYVKEDGWIDGWTDEWVDGWMDGRTDG